GQHSQEGHLKLGAGRNRLGEEETCVVGCPPTYKEECWRSLRVLIEGLADQGQRMVRVALGQVILGRFRGYFRVARLGRESGLERRILQLEVAAALLVGRCQIKPVPAAVRIQRDSFAEIGERAIRITVEYGKLKAKQVRECGVIRGQSNRPLQAGNNRRRLRGPLGEVDT
ncbi:MAG: hypothetical protein WA172_21660, partial [Terriglobales bacterium]